MKPEQVLCFDKVKNAWVMPGGELIYSYNEAAKVARNLNRMRQGLDNNWRATGELRLAAHETVRRNRIHIKC